MGSPNAGTENAATGPVGQVGAENPGMVSAPVAEILDENGQPFVTASDESINFGSVENRKGMPNAPIRVSEGFNNVDANGKNHGYGLRHIEAAHGQQIRNEGYGSVSEFIELVAKNYATVNAVNQEAAETPICSNGMMAQQYSVCRVVKQWGVLECKQCGNIS